MHIKQDLYGFRCECTESDRKNFYAYETEPKIKCLTCGVEYIKNSKGRWEMQPKEKIFPFKRYDITQETAGEDYAFIAELVKTLLAFKNMISEEQTREIYDVLRGVLETDNILSFARDLEKDCIYIFEYDWHKDKPHKSAVTENGLIYLTAI